MRVRRPRPGVPAILFLFFPSHPLKWCSIAARIWRSKQPGHRFEFLYHELLSAQLFRAKDIHFGDAL
jgi:hypothetical protein